MAYEVEEAKKLVIEAGHRLLNEGLIVRTWGNISARISDEQFVITPSGKNYEGLTPDDIVVVNIKNCAYEGDIKPSSECAQKIQLLLAEGTTGKLTPFTQIEKC